jgi:hypothetical protein
MPCIINATIKINLELDDKLGQLSPKADYLSSSKASADSRRMDEARGRP